MWPRSSGRASRTVTAVVPIRRGRSGGRGRGGRLPGGCGYPPPSARVDPRARSWRGPHRDGRRGAPRGTKGGRGPARPGGRGGGGVRPGGGGGGGPAPP